MEETPIVVEYISGLFVFSLLFMWIYVILSWRQIARLKENVRELQRQRGYGGPRSKFVEAIHRYKLTNSDRRPQIDRFLDAVLAREYDPRVDRLIAVALDTLKREASGENCVPQGLHLVEAAWEAMKREAETGPPRRVG